MEDGSQSLQSPEWNDQIKRIIGIIAFLMGLVLLLQFRAILPLVFTAVIVAYLLHPIADFFQNHVFGVRLRALAVMTTFLLVIAVLVVTLLFIIPALIDQIQNFIAGAPALVLTVQDWVLETLGEEVNLIGTPLERLLPEPVPITTLLGIEVAEGEVLETFDVISSQVENFDILAIARYLAASATNITGSAFSFVGGAVSTGLNVIFLLTMTFYLMTDGKNMIKSIEKAVPQGYQQDFHRMLSELGHVWNSYLRGQVILSLIMGTAMYLMASILGIPNAISLSIFAGIMEFIPNLGPAMAMVPAAAIALFSTSLTLPALSGVAFAIVVVIVWTILQQTEAVVLIPRIVGDSLNLHPFVVLVAILGGISVGGILAVLIAAPVVASVRLIAQYVYGKLTGREPFPVSRKTALQMQMERRPLLVRFGDICATWVRNLMSSRAVTKRR